MEEKQHPARDNIRRFKAEPLETSSRTNRPQNPHPPDNPAPPQAPKETHQPSDNTVRETSLLGQGSEEETEKPPTSSKPKTPRDLPQPTEVSSRQSRKKKEIREIDDNPEEEQRSSRETCSYTGDGARLVAKNDGGDPQSTISKLHPESASNETAKTRPLRRFQPEPVESTKRSRKKPATEAALDSPRRETPRKFAPQLIGTGKRSFRRADIKQDIDLASPPSQSTRNSISDSTDRSASDPELSRSFSVDSQFSYASLLQRQEGRRHSFRVPDLPAIPSNSSEESDDSDSLTTSRSGLSQNDTKFSTINDQFRESCDERFSGYLMSLAARSAEKQLRDQALAAFPNEQVHQPVSHFAIDGDEDFISENQGSSTGIRSAGETFRRESTTDLTWELEEMRRHKEEAQLKDRGKQQVKPVYESKFSAAAIASRQLERKQAFLADWQKDDGLKHMRHAASPPMLGDDIVFPFSTSPQGTTHEDDQDHSNRVEEPPKGGDGGTSAGLWTAYPGGGNQSGKGLWHGLCRKDEEPDLSPMRTGIVTPRAEIEADSYFSLNQAAHTSPSTQQLVTPSNSAAPNLGPTDKKSEIEKEMIEREFHDGFVSQVYNYLSLGYPSLARYYDHELSKISGIPVEELRKDDLHADARGYVGLPDRSKGDDKNRGTSDKCMRWIALRLYIQEWARQQPEMANNAESLDAWGVRERRGSWAV